MLRFKNWYKSWTWRIKNSQREYLSHPKLLNSQFLSQILSPRSPNLMSKNLALLTRHLHPCLKLGHKELKIELKFTIDQCSLLKLLSGNKTKVQIIKKKFITLGIHSKLLLTNHSLSIMSHQSSVSQPRNPRRYVLLQVCLMRAWPTLTSQWILAISTISPSPPNQSDLSRKKLLSSSQKLLHL